MKLFFGRININQPPKDQLSEAYYSAPKGTSYFGDLNHIEDFNVEPVYVFMIANSRVQLWRADHWGADGQNLYFTVVKPELDGMNGAWLAAFKYFRVNLDLIVFTIKRPFKKAFFHVDFDPLFTEELLLNDATYADEENYRLIKLANKKPDQITRDIQLYKSGIEWKISDIDFFDQDIIGYYRDNTIYAGGGRKRKDNTLKLIKSAKVPKDFNADDLAIWQLYDTYFCDYNAAEQVVENVERKFYKYSPGPQAIRWQHDWDTNTISIDSPDSGTDLSSVSSREELNVMLNLSPDSKSNVSWNLMLFKDANIGDVIFANSGVYRLLGVGIITGEYQYNDAVPEYKHTREVQWIATEPWDYQPNTIEGYKTLFRPDTFSPTMPFKEVLSAYVKQYPHYRDGFIQNGLYFAIEEQKTTEYSIDSEELPALNRILYGPPGTGKTYHTIDEAVRIIDGESTTDRGEYKKRFDILRNEGQVEFVTFHQNYTYEDFMVGIRPDAEFEELRFRPYKGIFYQIVQRAKENYLAVRQKRGITKSFSEVFDEFLKPLEKDEKIPVKMVSGKQFYITEVENGTIRFEKEKGSSTHTLSVSTLQSIVEGVREFNSGLGIYYQPIVKILQEIRKKDEGPKATIKRYVLIIDEINRANISRVFGELITLLEDDKRLGRENELKVTLPNGEKDFCIPSNLFVIGTMNTADKSIALLDVALRRRFEFTGYYPDPDVLLQNNQPAERVNLLKQVNEYIYQKKRSADYLIGHAYFLSKDSIEQILIKKVIPLLNEYFNNRSEEVELAFEKTAYKVKFNITKYKWDVTARAINEQASENI